MSEYDAPDNPPDLFALDDEADGQLSPHDDDLIAQPYTGALDRLSATERPRHKPRLKKRRTLAILLPLMVLALISTVFGMMMAVAADLPSLEQLPQTENRKNSELYDIRGHKIGTLASNEGRIIVKDGDIGAYMKYAVIATEDQRFYENSGVDLKGIARAFMQDVTSGGKAVQGGSTITQQFVKVATKNQDKRTIFNKLRESALAYHITHKWTKDKILTEYLNSIYFGNGAYGIESAARTYFSSKHPECGNPEIPIPGEPAPPCARVLVPGEAAMLAAVIASPSAYDPVAHPVAARDRRDMVLGKMLAQNRITKSQYDDALTVPIPDRDDIRTPKQDSIEPYFTSWVRQVLVDRVGAQKAFEGGLKVQTTIDLDLQKAARDAIANNLYRQDGSGPTAALVAIDNATGEVRAMVGGKNERDRTNSVEDDYQAAPFNLATQGQRQPGSAIKPFILATALENGIGPGSVWPSRKRTFGKGGNKFPVKNFGGFYYGNSTLANALTRSDNAVFAAVGIKVGTKKVAATANRMGIRTPISTNYAMTLGGLKQGVTPLDMAHAYETFAEDGELVTGSLAANDG
ncbi:MAG TPA: transglycosylase domain-containing protein, partial [Baekduia sp.]|nr:transglycosylase domain-containing protein [Baekduia sp.]